MEKTVVFGFLMLCAIVSQGLCTSLKESDKTSVLHIRHKRLVGRPAHMAEAPFLVSLVSSGISYCPATLISDNVAITAAACFQSPNPGRWHIRAGSTFHAVVDIVRNGLYHSEQQAFNNLALVFIGSRINSTYNYPLSIYNERPLAAEHVAFSVFNWHVVHVGRHRQLSTSDINMLSVKLIEFHHCQSRYPGGVGVDNLCAKSVINREHLDMFDHGAPLVTRSGQLVGIFATRGPQPEDPEVFTSLLTSRVQEWIHRFVPALRLL